MNAKHAKETFYLGCWTQTKAVVFPSCLAPRLTLTVGAQCPCNGLLQVLAWIRQLQIRVKCQIHYI